MKDRAGPAQMRFDYAPGLYGLSDFSGKTLALRTGRGEKDVEIFVAILAHSCLIYAEAVPDQRVRHWTMAHRRALEYFGGVPERWIIDNLKAGVNKPDREEPQLNPSFREFAQHYNVAVLPARSGRATDKGMVEAAVGAVQTRILLALRHETFFSLDTMKRRDPPRARPAQPRPDGLRREPPRPSRGERAGVSPAPAPEPLGVGRVGPPARSGRTAMCVSSANYYSVRDGNVGRGVAARIGERMVEVFLEEGGERIAVHPRKNGRNQYATLDEHMPDRLKAVRDIRKPDYGDILLDRARRVGPSALAWAERCFASRDFPEQAFATVQGMIRLAEDHGEPRLDALCAEALDLNRLASGFLRERIKNGARPDRPPTRSPGDHPRPRQHPRRRLLRQQ